MREILFRGKARDTKCWVYGSLLFSNKIPAIRDKNNVYWYVIRESIGEYTGVTDSDGIRIYEGDYVRYGNNEPDLCQFDSGAFRLVETNTALKFISDYKFECHVVGNAFDGRFVLE